jgi:hypothetical protein
VAGQRAATLLLISAVPQGLAASWFPDTILTLLTAHERALHYSHRHVIVCAVHRSRMRASSILCLGFLVGLTSIAYAAEAGKNKQLDELTSIQLGDYSLRYEGDAPHNTIAPDSPPGMANFRKETTGPFLGLKFSTPLKDDFFKLGR